MRTAYTIAICYFGYGSAVALEVIKQKLFEKASCRFEIVVRFVAGLLIDIVSCAFLSLPFLKNISISGIFYIQNSYITLKRHCFFL
jgi:hypothetical protein